MKNSSSFDGTEEHKMIGLKVTARQNEENVIPARRAQLYGMTTHLQEAEKEDTLLKCYPCDKIKVNNEFTVTLK